MQDFTESDLFTIDGDSVLADVFAQYGLDFSHGGQMLHLTYLVELFLKVRKAFLDLIVGVVWLWQGMGTFLP